VIDIHTLAITIHMKTLLPFDVMACAALLTIFMSTTPWNRFVAAFSTLPPHMPAGQPLHTIQAKHSFSAPLFASESEKLFEKAATLRAEIAALEGKSLEQVEQEAREKKEERVMAESQREQQIKSRGDSGIISSSSGWKVEVPGNARDMVVQAARAVERAYKDGLTRQTVRFNLVNVADDELQQTGFESMNLWPGGARQMYREAGKPLTMELLKTLRVDPNQLLSPQVTDQDIWDFDGSALISSQAKEGPQYDVQAMVFPNTDVKYINDIATIDEVMKGRLFILVNPFWRNLDSWGINLLAPRAKSKAAETIFNRGYNETYVFLRFGCRGEECIALKVYPHDWQIFAYVEDDVMGWSKIVRLGTCKDEPKNDFVTGLINARPEFKLSKTMRQMKR
jgi:Domain of unknown function (DUF1995)